jgi:uncharacterized membrane protein/DNA-binding MarR family transcriptional regulator
VIRSPRLLGAFFIATGVNHFVMPRAYQQIVPPSIRGSAARVVALSGVAEIAAGAGVLLAPTRRVAGRGLIALLAAVFPANLFMARAPERFPRIPRWALYARLPLQPLMMWWAWTATHGRAADSPLPDARADAAMFAREASGSQSMTTATVKIAAREEGALITGIARTELGERAWRGLLRTHACLVKRMDAELERAHGLPLSSYEVLHHLAQASSGRMRMCDLAEHAHLSRSGLTRLVDRLERDGLLDRCSCEHDARGAYACLTEAGRERLAEARSTQLAVVREHFSSHFSAAEVRAMADMWERIAPCNGI